MTKHRQRKAFTIVEMVIVIAVIAILATVLIPTVAGVIQRATISADTQFAASLNIQLAMYSVDKDIANESDLRDAINYYYGNEENPDYYASFAPKSGKYGYHYWYDTANNQVVLKTVAELVGDGTMPTAMPAGFALDSLRSGLVEGYFFMDHSNVEEGNIGENITDLISAFETLPDPGVYEQLITETLPALLESEKYGAVAANIENRLKVTTIVTDGGAFRYEANDAEDICHVWVPITTTKLQQTKVYVYNGSVVDDGQNSDKLAGAAVEGIHFPAGVTSGLGGMPAIYVDPYEDDELVRHYENTTKLYVQTNDIAELEKIFTDCVLVTPNGSRYVFVGDTLYSLPITIDATTKQPVGSGVGSVNNEIMTGIDAIGIECKEASTSVKGEDKVYLYDGTLYVAYDKGSVKLSLTDGVTNGMVTWSSANTDLATVDATGTVTLKLPQVTQGAVYSVDITATYKYDTSVSATVKVFIARPTSVSLKVGTAGVELYNDTDKGAINISYEGNNASNAIVFEGVESNAAEFVKIDAGVLAYETPGTLFAVTDNKLVINTAVLDGTASQDLTIIYKNANGTEYLRRTYTVTIEDNSTVGLKKNQITSTVAMGEKYLFRVGNGNAFKLSSLFSALEESKDVAIKSVKIYNAAKTDANGRYEIVTSGTGFRATYTANSNWKEATIQFGGTGVAIIEVNTAKGKVELAVEVVDGKNVTSASDFTGATNYVLMNDITWGTANKTAINGTLYGNGFAINAQSFTNATQNSNNALFYLNGGTIDNLVINGPVYPELIYQSEVSSSKPYYVMGIYTTGDAAITNSYISGFRSPVMANGTSLYLENTTLVGGNYANLWLQTGSLTLKSVTTVQEPTTATIGNGTILGAGIIADSGINASNVTIIGDLTQYNWVTKDQASAHMDSNVSSLIDKFFNNTTITHTVNGTKYINTGIVFQSTTGTVNNASQTAGHGYTTETVSGSLMGESFTGNVYTRTTTSGAVTSIPTYGGYSPNTQSVIKPAFKHNLTLTNGEVRYSIDIPKGETAKLIASGYTVSKYSGQNIVVNITCPGATVDNTKKEVTFTKAGTYTVTYTVVDNTFYNADGSKQTKNNEDAYTVTVVVSNSNHPNAVINLSGLTKETKWVESGNLFDKDYSAYFEVLGGLVITDYDENGNSFTVQISASNLNGLTIEATSGSQYTEITGTSVDGTKYWMYDIKADDDKADRSVKFTYTYKGKNGNTVTATSTDFTLKASTSSSSGGGCVTGDTLVTLADGTQKEIQYVTYEDMLLVWNFNTGKYDVMPSAIVMNHGYANYTVVTLNFSDGTTVNTINGHGFFDIAEKQYVIIDENNAAEYIGHAFAKVNGDGYATVTLDSFSVGTKYTESWSILTAVQYNCILENMWTLTPAEVEGSPYYLMPFEIGADMKYDEAKMQADIEKYGLYTYEDFADYCTYEQFVGFGFANFKVSVEKGYITWDDIEFLLNLHLGGTK